MKVESTDPVTAFSDQPFANLIFLPMRVHGREVTAFFDTGASLSFVSKSLSEELQLPLLKAQRRGGNNQGRMFSFPLAVVENMELGGISTGKVTVGILPEGALDMGKDEEGNLFPASMILGYDVLQKFCFTFHMERRVVLIEPGGRMPSEGSLTWNRFMILEAEYNGEKLKIGFDSGHTDSMLDSSWRKRALQRKKDKVMRTGIGSSSEEDVWTTEKLLLTLHGVEVLLEKAEIISGEIPGAESGSICGLLGMDAVEKHVWTMDAMSGYFSINR